MVAYSEDPSSRDRGGELGNHYLRRDDPAALETLGAAFLQQVFTMQQGDPEQLVESRAGFHVVRVAELGGRVPGRAALNPQPATRYTCCTW